MIITKEFLSGSANGKGILVSGTDTATATTIHTSVAGTSSMDEVWIYAQNNHTANVLLTLEWGDATSNNNIIITTISKDGLVAVVPGFILNNSSVIKAFAATGNVITIHGFVNRIVL